MVKDKWLPLPLKCKKKFFKKSIAFLMRVDKGLHPLYNMKKQGYITEIKKRLTTNIFNALKWEEELQSPTLEIINNEHENRTDS